MIRSFFLGSVIVLTSMVSFAAIEHVSTSDAKTLREKLTGHKKLEAPQGSTKKTVVEATQKAVSIKTTHLKPAQKGLALAREAKNEKNYVLAIKRYNFILKYFSKTSEARQALLDKAEIYKSMGLDEQAQYNTKRAKKMAVVITPGIKIKK